MHVRVKASSSSFCFLCSAWQTVIPTTCKFPQHSRSAHHWIVSHQLGAQTLPVHRTLIQQILNTTFYLFFLIFMPPPHNMPLSCCPKNFLHLVLLTQGRRIPSYACGYQRAPWGTRLMEVACDLCVSSCT